ncbi:MAG: NAD-dependent epimerase/dehydratase family protein [Streptosporangiaceae bacterium]
MLAQTLLVTGATGFLGGNLTRRLLADGVQDRVLARSASRTRPLADLRRTGHHRRRDEP